MIRRARRRSRPVSRVLFPGPKAGVAAISLGRQLPDASSNLTRSTLPEGIPDGPSFSHEEKAEPIRSCSGWGLPSFPGRPGNGELLPRHFTLTPNLAAGAVYFLWHFPSRRRDSVLRSTLPCGARTFLSRGTSRCPASGHPADSDACSYYITLFSPHQSPGSPFRRRRCSVPGGYGRCSPNRCPS
jgi:hypothetical protein